MHSIMPIKRQVMPLHPPISMTSIVAMHETHDKDKERILRCLRNGPRTCKGAMIETGVWAGYK